MRVLTHLFISLLVIMTGNTAFAVDRSSTVDDFTSSRLVIKPPQLISISPKDCVKPDSKLIVNGNHLGSVTGQALVVINGRKQTSLKTLSWSRIKIVAYLSKSTDLVSGMRYEIGIENTHTGKLTGNKKFIQICKEQEKRNIEASVSRQEGVSRQENSSGEDNYTPSSGSSRIAERSHIPETIDNEYEPRELIAISNDMVKGQMLEKVIQDLGYRIIRRKPVKHLGFVFTTIRLPEGTVLKEAIKKIEQKVDVRIDKNHRFRPAGNNSGKIYAHKLMKWNNQTGCGKGIRIGMIDTGVDENHPAFAKARIESKSFFPAGIKPASVRHGTAIASILIGDREFNGMLPNASLYSAQVFRELKNGHTDTTAEYIIYALDWLLGKQVLAINFSLAGAKNELLEYAIKKVANKKIFIAAAGGNNGANAQPVYPAAYKQVVAVTAVDANLDIYSKANQGDYIEVSAPGVDIWAARAGGQGAYYSGTSFATPFVTVTGALLRQRSTKEILGINTRDLGDEGRDSVYGLGLIQLNKLCKN